jgi:hypothetical protein
LENDHFRAGRCKSLRVQVLSRELEHWPIRETSFFDPKLKILQELRTFCARRALELFASGTDFKMSKSKSRDCVIDHSTMRA